MRWRLFVIAAAVLWSTAGAAIKLTTLDAWQVSGGRSLVAALALLALLPGARHLPTKRGLAVSVAYAATVTLFVVANKLTTAANAIFLQDTAPLHLLWLSPWLLHERPSRRELLSMPIFLAGLSMVFFDQLAPGQLIGNVVALASGISFALTILGLRAANRESASVLTWGNLVAAIAVLPLAVQGPSPRASDVGIIAFLGIFQLALAYLLFTKGLERTPAIEASLLMLIEPVLNPLWTFLFAGEKPGPWALAGGAVILAAVSWHTLAAGRLPPDAPARRPSPS